MWVGGYVPVLGLEGKLASWFLISINWSFALGELLGFFLLDYSSPSFTERHLLTPWRCSKGCEAFPRAACSVMAHSGRQIPAGSFWICRKQQIDFNQFYLISVEEKVIIGRGQEKGTTSWPSLDVDGFDGNAPVEIPGVIPTCTYSLNQTRIYGFSCHLAQEMWKCGWV